ncbi:hypothetical protein N9Z70_04695 [Mariniblastus sp.]|nr:hypothetical protein [Mariniblastus sp.]
MWDFINNYAPALSFILSLVCALWAYRSQEAAKRSAEDAAKAKQDAEEAKLATLKNIEDHQRNQGNLAKQKSQVSLVCEVTSGNGLRRTLSIRNTSGFPIEKFECILGNLYSDEDANPTETEILANDQELTLNYSYLTINDDYRPPPTQADLTRKPQNSAKKNVTAIKKGDPKQFIQPPDSRIESTLIIKYLCPEQRVVIWDKNYSIELCGEKV